MVRLVVVIITVSVIVIAGLIIYIISWGKDTVSVSINAIPWARVSIKPPESNFFIEPRPEHFTIPPEPNARNANVTPIRGGLNVPVGTTIKLVYQEKEKIFSYETWKDGATISHDFLSQ